MYKHHEESLQNLIEYYLNKFEDKDSIIAIIFGGSVAKGNERPDSDLDCMIVLTPECHKRRLSENRVTETVSGYCTYEKGYFDTKFITKEFLELAAVKASEPTRNSFVGSRVLYTTDDDIYELINTIPVFQKHEISEKMLSFRSSLFLEYEYFWKVCKAEGFMKLRTAANIIYAIYRMILQENEVLFPCNRRLEETVANVQDKPDHIIELAAKFEKSLSTDDLTAFVTAYFEWSKYPHETNVSNLLSQYTNDLEKWWQNPRPQIYEW